jgi:hypothetical protein
MTRTRGRRIWRALFVYAADRDVASDAVAEAFRPSPGPRR